LDPVVVVVVMLVLDYQPPVQDYPAYIVVEDDLVVSLVYHQHHPVQFYDSVHTDHLDHDNAHIVKMVVVVAIAAADHTDHLVVALMDDAMAVHLNSHASYHRRASLVDYHYPLDYHYYHLCHRLEI
jgi:hypothetical protein